MPLVTVKRKYQVVIPQELRDELSIGEGDVLEAEVIDGKIVYTPKQVIDRDVAFEEMRAIAKTAEKRWRAEGLNDKDIEKLIQEEVDAVRHG